MIFNSSNRPIQNIVMIMIIAMMMILITTTTSSSSIILYFLFSNTLLLKVLEIPIIINQLYNYNFSFFVNFFFDNAGAFYIELLKNYFKLVIF